MATISSINNPILNSPYKEPTRHFRFDANDQVTDHVDAGRRGSSYFLPIAAPKKKGAPGLFDALEEKKEESGHVNRIGLPIAGEKKTTNLVYGPGSNAISLLETRLRWAESRNLIRECLSRTKNLGND